MKDNKWSYKPLSSLCGINLGSTPSRSKSEYWGKGYPWVSISDLKGKYISKTKEEITDAALAESNCKIVKEGTLLMSFKLSIGKLAFAEKDLYTNEAIVALPIKDDSELLKDYLYFVLKSIPLVGGNQAAMGHTLNKQSLSVLQIPIPPTLDDQKRIAKVLSQCEMLIQKRKESIDFLDDLLNSTFMNMFGDIRTNSRNIPQEKLGKLYGKGFLVDGPFGSAIKVDVDYVDHGTIPIIRTKNIKRFQFSDKDLKFILEEKYEQINRSNVIPGDILISKVGTIGNVCLFPDKFPKAVLSTTGSSRIRNTRKDINTNYLLYYLDRYKELMINRASDGVLKFLTLGHIRDFIILIPDISEQVKFSDLVTKVEAAKNTYSDSLKELENLYESIGQRTFKGLLNLNKVDISDMEDSKKKDLEEVKEEITEEIFEELIESFEHTLPTGEVPTNRETDIRNMSIRQYLRLPDDEASKDFEFSKMDKDYFYQFILTKGFPERTFTLPDLEQYAKHYILKGTGFDFTYENWKTILFRFIEAKQPIIEQLFDAETKTIKLKLTDEAFKV